VGPQIRNINPRIQLHVDVEDVQTKPLEFFARFDVIIATELDFETYTTINKACRMANRPFYAAGLHGFYGYIFVDPISHDFVTEREKMNVVPPQEASTRTILNITTEKNNMVIEMVMKRETYSPLQVAMTSLLTCLLALWEFQKRSDGRSPTTSRSDLEMFTTLVNELHLELCLDPSTLDAEFLHLFLQSLGSELSTVAAFVGASLAQDVINVLSEREKPLHHLFIFDCEKGVSSVYTLHHVDEKAKARPVDRLTVQEMRAMFPEHVVVKAMYDRNYEL
jgi:ubiquitin-like 1-activating enzyme E1 A